ncbi:MULTISPECIES: 16S rRNA (cytosine(967)-C(5))-methyltransferase RsmB [unclassified Cohnella]|uniref:16S rRNA (cytosine(967)-C(5))-methyltransferase RsmB n=1 Tax=Cohnella sp. OV330 TaxID=1855288 RepID=UPI000B7F27D1
MPSAGQTSAQRPDQRPVSAQRSEPAQRSSAQQPKSAQRPTSSQRPAHAQRPDQRSGQRPGQRPPSAAQPSKPSAPRKPQTAREVALRVLLRVEEQGAFSGLELNRVLTDAGLSRPDAALATELVYGTIQRRFTIDHVLAARVKGWPNKVEPWVRCLLRLSYYQLRWLDRVPAHAVTDEAVRIAKKRGHGGIAGLVNGTLRALLREGVAPPLPAELPAAERLSLVHSYPLWLAERWVAAYGEAGAEALMAAGNEPPHMSVRANRLRGTRDALLAELTGAGVYAEPSKLSPDGIVAARAGSLAQTPWYASGRLSVQDESSMLVAAVCDPRPGMNVLDCCAAPGGKAAHMAERMAGQGRVTANDVHPHKEALIREQADRLGLPNVVTTVSDALSLSERLVPGSMDVVLLDAPCSGLGVIRRKPEIKWNKSADDIASLASLQRRLLASASRMVKPGGRLVYSTCTIAPEENEEAVRDFLNAHPDFRLDPAWPEETLAPLRDAGVVDDGFAGMAQLLPQHFGSDGFFIARLARAH